LIINELVTNALKYAFPPAFLRDAAAPASCEITIGIRMEGTLISLTVGDNGMGLPEGFDWRKAKSLGLRLVNILACNQLRGTIGVETSGGTTFTITFTELQTKQDKLKHT
jgi:two-component sensor histidine kinase